RDRPPAQHAPAHPATHPRQKGPQIMSLPVVASLFLAVTAPPAGGAATSAPKPQASAPAQMVLKDPAIAPKTESACGIVTKTADANSKPEFHQVDGFKLLGAPGQLTLPASKVPVVAVYCKRDTLVPGPGDGRVIWQLREPLVLQDVS